MNSIREILSKKEKSFSFEIFPPKTPEGEAQLFKNLAALQTLNPHFISVTMGAMGSNQRNTLEIVEKIEKEGLTIGIAHLTCIGSEKETLKKSLQEIKSKGIRHLLCLRGDLPPNNPHPFPANGFRYANELVEFIRAESGDYFTLGVAGYPEGHIEAKNLEEDLKNLKRKVDAGAEFVITQLFFNNDDYFQFVDKAKKLGIEIPIIPGIMPITNFSQLDRFIKMCGAKIPPTMRQDLLKIKEDAEKVKEYGIQYAVKQCQDLIQRGAPGLHFYILNQAGPIQKIYQSLSFQK